MTAAERNVTAPSPLAINVVFALLELADRRLADGTRGNRGCQWVTPTGAAGRTAVPGQMAWSGPMSSGRAAARPAAAHPRTAGTRVRRSRIPTLIRSPALTRSATSTRRHLTCSERRGRPLRRHPAGRRAASGQITARLRAARDAARSRPRPRPCGRIRSWSWPGIARWPRPARSHCSPRSPAPRSSSPRRARPGCWLTPAAQPAVTISRSGSTRPSRIRAGLPGRPGWLSRATAAGTAGSTRPPRHRRRPRGTTGARTRAGHRTAPSRGSPRRRRTRRPGPRRSQPAPPRAARPESRRRSRPRLSHPRRRRAPLPRRRRVPPSATRWCSSGTEASRGSSRSPTMAPRRSTAGS